MLPRAIGLTVTALVALTACDHTDAAKYTSPEAIATAIGCRTQLGPSGSNYHYEVCAYHGRQVHIWTFTKDGESTGFLYASQGNGFVLGSRFLVKCSHGSDCQTIERVVGGKAYVSTGSTGDPPPVGPCGYRQHRRSCPPS